MDESEDATSPSLILEDSHTISYRYRDSTVTRNSKPKEAENSKKKSEKSLLSPLIPFLSKPPLTCIPIESPLFNVLHLLSVVNALNALNSPPLLFCSHFPLLHFRVFPGHCAL